ncbi:MAG: CidA/LrgA family protein [Gudongella sp.]|nr:CidA/LrgA family protein [Gudongella sp.]
METLKQLGIILLILWIGNFIQNIFSLALPGNVLGMIILLILLTTNILKLNSIERISETLLNHLTFLFIPTSVGIMTVLYLLKGNVISLLIIVYISLFVVMITTGLTVQFMINLKNKKRRESK